MKIARLSDQQALSIVDSVAGEFAVEGMPEGRTEPARVLAETLGTADTPVSADALLDADSQRAARAARELLEVMAEAPEMRASISSPSFPSTAARSFALAAVLSLVAPYALPSTLIPVTIAWITCSMRSGRSSTSPRPPVASNVTTSRPGSS